MNPSRLGGVAALSLLSGCSILTPPVEVSRRYDRIEPVAVDCARREDANAAYCYEASVSALPVIAPEAELAIGALSDRGQEAYVSSLAALTKDPAALRGAMATPMRPAGGTVPDYQDRSQLRLRFVLGLAPANGYLYPGDRLEWAKITIRPIGPSGKTGRFMGWTHAANAFEAIEVGSLTSTRSEKLTGETGLKIADFAPEAKVAAEFAASTEEKVDIKDRVTISAMIREGVATIVQTGGWRRDLAGNATFDATVGLPPDDTMTEDYTTTSDYRTATASGASAKPGWTRPSDMTIGQRYVRVPVPSPVCAEVALEFVARRIVAGARTFSESNDRVQAIRGRTVNVQNVAQLPASDRWVISVPVTSKGRTGTAKLQFLGDDRSEQVLAFSGKNEALAFIRWMSNSGVTGRVGNGVLWFRAGQPFGADEISEMDGMNEAAGKNWAALNASCRSGETRSVTPAD